MCVKTPVMCWRKHILVCSDNNRSWKKKNFVEVIMKFNITKYIDRCNTVLPASLNLVMIHINGDSFKLARVN